MITSRLTSLDSKGIYQFVGSTTVTLSEKEATLDELMAQAGGEELISATRQFAEAKIGSITQKIIHSIWHPEQAKISRPTNLRIAKYVFHHLTAAMNKCNPTSIGVYFYLVNSERDDKAKFNYLLSLLKRDAGTVIISLAKQVARDLMLACDILFGEAGRHFQVDHLDSPPEQRLTAIDVYKMILQFEADYQDEIIEAETRQKNALDNNRFMFRK